MLGSGFAFASNTWRGLNDMRLGFMLIVFKARALGMYVKN